MNCTIADVDKAVRRLEFTGHKKAWHPYNTDDNEHYQEFLAQLQKGPVELNIGRAELREEHYGGEYDSYGYFVTDASWFIFMLIGEDGSVQYFRRQGWSDSYGSNDFNGPTEEVSYEKIVAFQWVTI